MIDDILKYKLINRLKSVYRLNSLDSRKESSAEHSWSALMLADYLIDACSVAVNKQRVFEILLYHDLVEIQTGDVPLHPDFKREDKSQNEEEGAKILAAKLPTIVADKFLSAFTEFEKRETPEAKFAKVIDNLDAEIHELDYKDDWKDYPESFLRSTKEKYMVDFPELRAIFEELVLYMRENGYFEDG